MTIDIVVADDLTGTSDTLVQFTGSSAPAIVFPSLYRFESAVRMGTLRGDLAIGVNTESRHLEPLAASTRVRRAHCAALRLKPRLLFQKVDSALRGNPGAELQAYRQATGSATVLMTPAFLPSRRTVRNGILYLDGVPLGLSEVAGDIRTPRRDSSVAAIISRQTDGTVSHLSVPVGRNDRLTAGIVIADAQSSAELEHLAALALANDLLHAVSGSAGLAAALSEQLGFSAAAAVGDAVGALPALVLFGSPHPTATRQLAIAADVFGSTILKPTDAGRGIRATRRLLSAAGYALAGRHELALLCAPDRTESAPLSPDRVADGLGRIAFLLARAHRIGSLVVSGGDVAASVCAALRVEHIELGGQIFPGAPLGRICGGIANGVWLVTKSGAHGDRNGLVTILETLGVLNH